MSRGGLRRTLLIVAVIGLGVLLHRPGLSAGLAADDYLQRAMVDGSYPVERSPLDLYAFVDASRGELPRLMDAGIFPWWVHPHLKLTALRPLSSLLVYFDVRALGSSDLAAHLHSLAWFALLLAALALLFQSLFSERVALLATAIYAFDPLHVMPVAWLANRAVLVSATFALLGLWGHIRWRERGWRPGAFLSGAGAALALSGGEYGISALGYLVAYELSAGPGRRLDRMRALALAAVPAALYAGTYLALGYGAEGSSVYVDPFRSPGWFILLASVRLPALLLNEFLSIPGELTSRALILGYGRALIVLLPPLVLLGALMPGMLRRLRWDERRMLVFLMLGNGLSILPLLGTIPSPRLLVVPAIGGAVLLALLIRDGVTRVGERAARFRVGTWWRALVALSLALAHLVVSPMTTLSFGTGWSTGQVLVRALYQRGDIDDREVAHQQLILLNSFNHVSAIYPPWARHHAGSPLPGSWRALTTSPASQELTRTSTDTFELAAVGGTLLDLAATDLLRSADAPFRSGDRVTLRGLSAEVLESSPWGPSRVRFRFDRALDDPSLVFLEMTADGVRRVTLPRIGGTRAIPGAPLPILSPPPRP